jgi:hypothetical protein
MGYAGQADFISDLGTQIFKGITIASLQLGYDSGKIVYFRYAFDRYIK